MVLTYYQDETRPNKDWVLRTDAPIDGDSLAYLDAMERNSAEEKRRHRERIMMEEGKALWKAKKSEDLELELKEQEEIRELSRLKLFGKPGHGAPTHDIRKKRFTEYQMAEIERKLREEEEQRGQPFGWSKGSKAGVMTNGDEMNGVGGSGRTMALADVGVNIDQDGHDALSFGRPGYGAPVRTKSGRVRTLIRGNPEIRFQDNESVKKTIFNAIRYQTDPELKAQYHRDLEEQVRQRKEAERAEKARERSIAQELEQVEGKQWGKPGPGGTYWRGSAVTGQGFFDKMGWCDSADPRKRQFDVRHHEAEDMKKEMEEVRHRKDQQHQESVSAVGVELVPLLKEKPTGKPRKDPSTGYLMNHSLPSTDVTKIGDPKRAEVLYSARNPEERKQYYDTLNSQIQSRSEEMQRNKRNEEEEQARHFQSWETFWGRPGYGAPREGRTQKENLMKILHYPDKAPNHVELITLERLPTK